ncbi:MAG: 50S ribosomal protein L10 [Pseudobdellovibrionaceae bacterium]
MITREIKEASVKSISEKFAKSKATFVVDFKGLKVEQVTDLRKKLFPIDSEMKVVRNTLVKRALTAFPDVEKALSAHFKGTNALVFSYGDITATAKLLSTFAKDIEVFQLKTGAMDGQALDAKKINFLATLPGKEQLRAQFLGVLQAPASKLARTLNEVPASLARVLAAKT